MTANDQLRKLTRHPTQDFRYFLEPLLTDSTNHRPRNSSKPLSGPGTGCQINRAHHAVTRPAKVLSDGGARFSGIS